MSHSVGSVGDITGTDLSHGKADDGILVDRCAGEVVLAPTEVAQFDGNALPAGWTASPYLPGGQAALGGGVVHLAGARVGTDALFIGNRSLEFQATFGARSDQNVGFGLDFVNVPWVMFGTKWGRSLYARTHFVVSEDKKLTGDWLGAPHRFRIAWRVLDVVFEIDGEQVAKVLVPMPPLMRPLAANLRADDEGLTVAWMRVSPYRPSGVFISRPLDAGREVCWGEAEWRAVTPHSTTIALGIRRGNTAVPDQTWSPWTTMATRTAFVGGSSRYLQYRAELAASDPSLTPALQYFSASYHDLERATG